MRFLKFLCKGEVVFAGFILSSVFKAMFNSPVDLTALFMGWSILIGIKRLAFNKTIDKRAFLPISLFVILSALIIGSFLYAPESGYAMRKAFLFVTLTAWSFIGVFILIRNSNSLKLFIEGLLFYCIITTGYTVFDFFATGATTDYGRFGINESNILGLARLSGFGAVIILVLYLYNNNKPRKKIIPLFLFLISVTALMLTGSRMPLVAFLVSLAVLFIMSFRFKRIKFSTDIRISKKLFSLILLIPIIILLLVPFVRNGIFYTSITRFLRLFSGEGNVDAARTGIYEFALSMWEDSPFLGKGIGSFPMHYWGVDRRDYPHNIFIEALSELGLFGFAMVVALMIVAIATIIRSYRMGLDNYQIVVVLGFVYFLLNANTTGDFNDNRILFMFIALTSMLPAYNASKESDKGTHKPKTVEKERTNLVV